MSIPVTVVVENKSCQTLSVGILIAGKVTEVKIPPHESHGPVSFDQLTAYTRRLAEQGRVYIRAQN